MKGLFSSNGTDALKAADLGLRAARIITAEIEANIITGSHRPACLLLQGRPLCVGNWESALYDRCVDHNLSSRHVCTSIGPAN